MKIVTENQLVERNATVTTSEFKIKATAKAFNILSSGLYSDKILAIIRELCCNAYDAHVAAGKADVPFEVHLPTVFAPTFYVKDFGVGLSEEAVMDLYTTYFESTKTDSNEYIGALGLGSKSPFSYTNTFTVESRFNGTKHVFTAYLNEQGLPSIDKLASIPTDEANGLTVMFPVKKDDIYYNFRTKAQQALMYFNPQPKVLGWAEYAPHKVNVILRGTNWKIVDRTTSNITGAFVKQGPIIYPINAEILEREGTLSPIAKELLKQSIDVEVNVGDVDVAASREALSYDKRTIRNLISAFENAAAEFVSKINEAFEQIDTLWQARQYLHFLLNSNTNLGRLITALQAKNILKITWNNQELRDFMVEVNLSFVRHVNVTSVYYSKNKDRLCGLRPKINTTTIGFLKYGVAAKKNTFVLFADLTRSVCMDVIGQFLKANSDINLSDPTAIVITPLSRKENQLAAAKHEALRIAKELGGAPVLNVSELPFTSSKKTNKSTYKGREKNQVLAWQGFGSRYGAYSRNTWKTVECDLAAGGLYVIVDRFTPMWNGKIVRHFDRIMKVARVLNIEFATFPVGMSKKQVLAAKKAGTWKDFFSVLKEKIELLNKDNSITNSLLYKQLITENSTLGLLLSQSPQWIEAITTDYPNPKSVFSKTLIDYFAQVYAKVKYRNNIEDIQEVCFFLDILSHEKLKKECEALKSAWALVQKTHPMLSIVNFDTPFYSNPDNMKIVLQYVENK